MIVTVHKNSNDINQYLPNKDVYNNQRWKSNQESIIYQ